jgi:FAD/FMN-containing dehydrogenase
VIECAENTARVGSRAHNGGPQVPLVDAELSGWGNFSLERCRVLRPRSVSDIEWLMAGDSPARVIARGLGRAYGDSSLNRDEGVVELTSLNRFRAFDPQMGVLECEAGVSIAEIIEFLLPRGWFVSTTPGTKHVTIGGAIAADVHGKNHHCDGSFGKCVLDFLLMTADGSVVRCSPQENAELFWGTIGGMGLTGIILQARLQLRRVDSAYVRVNYKRTANLDETLEYFAQTNSQFRYSVAWIDCLAQGASLGRSVVMLGNDAVADDLRARHRGDRFRPRPRGNRDVPVFMPHVLLNRWSMGLMNSAYYASHPDAERVVDYETFFYPLDFLSHWNRIYGRRGFVQYQVLFSPATSRQGLIEVLEAASRSGMASFLAVLKSSGPASGGALSYLFPGHTLAMDFPNNGPGLRRLADELDRIVLKHGGRLYLAKDALMSAGTFAEMYPESREFLRLKACVDPENRFSSSQARRVGLAVAT